MEDDMIKDIRKTAEEGVRVIDLYVKNRVEKLSDLLAENPNTEKVMDKGRTKFIADLEASLKDDFRKAFDMHEPEQIFEVGRSLGRLEAVELISGLTLKKRK